LQKIMTEIYSWAPYAIAKMMLIGTMGNLPLIRTHHPSVPQWKRGHGAELVLTAQTEQTGSALLAAGIYAALKRFFRHAARSAAAAGLNVERFAKASSLKRLG
jgi:hypothetical protein